MMEWDGGTLLATPPYHTSQACLEEGIGGAVTARTPQLQQQAAPNLQKAAFQATGECLAGSWRFNRHATLFHHFLDVPVAQRIGRIPADANQDHIDRKARPFEVEQSGSNVRTLQST